jgi:hypothetical protein
MGAPSDQRIHIHVPHACPAHPQTVQPVAWAAIASPAADWLYGEFHPWTDRQAGTHTGTRAGRHTPAHAGLPASLHSAPM